MTRSILVLSLLFATASAEPTPQAIIDYDRPPPRFGEVATETHFVRGDLTRIDQRIIPAGMQITILRQKYTRPDQPFTFETTRSADGQLIGASISDDPHSAPPAMALRQSAGAAETRVGETCRPWEVSQKTSSNRSFVQSGCATVDGIELWRKQGSINAIYATRVRRTAVARDAVRLPFEALDTAQLVRRDAGKDHRFDYEVLLAGRGGGTELHRRSGNWFFLEETVDQTRTISVRNLLTGMEIRYFRSKNGERQWSWSRPYRTINQPIAKPTEAAAPSARQQAILGEQCTWQDASPNVVVFDGSKGACRTADGIVLVSAENISGPPRIMTATRLLRRVQPVSAITLPAELTDRAAWGVPDRQPVE